MVLLIVGVRSSVVSQKLNVMMDRGVMHIGVVCMQDPCSGRDRSAGQQEPGGSVSHL